MRSMLIALLIFAAPCWASQPKPEDFSQVFELAGLSLLCEQSAPMVGHQLSAEQQDDAAKVFEPKSLCFDLAARLATRVSQQQLQAAERLLGSDLAKEFSAVERDVGENLEGLSAYRERLAQEAPRGARLALVQRLDKAARTTALATVLRYEAGKTRAYLMNKARGAVIDEQQLSERTRSQEEALRKSSLESVESFMLFAYRHKPSDQLTRYTELYEQPEVDAILGGAVELLPQLFAERRARM